MSDLKMVNGKTYIDARVNGGEAVRLGDVVTVDDPKVAKDLLSLTFTDKKDNVRKYFRDVTAPDVVDEVDEEDVEQEDLEDAPADAPAAPAKDSAPAAPRRKRGAQ